MSAYPVIDKYVGVWEGTYTLLDAKTGAILDHHQSRIQVHPPEGNRYYQTNTYTWADGTKKHIEFPAELRDGKIIFDTPRLTGEAVEVGDDMIVLTWSYKDKPGEVLAELIRLTSPTHRCRTWQYTENGQFTKLMVIEETKVA